MRDLLRSLPVFASEIRVFDTDAAPARPRDLFVAWLDDAIEAGVAEPHAMTMSTVDPAGDPDARVLILNDLDDTRWCSRRAARASRDSISRPAPAAALTFYWPGVGRAVRIRAGSSRAVRCAPVADISG